MSYHLKHYNCYHEHALSRAYGMGDDIAGDDAGAYCDNACGTRECRCVKGSCERA